MKKNYIFTIIVLFLLISALVVSPMAVPYTSNPEHLAHAVILADAQTGDILYARNEHERIHPASLTKIMTALLAVEALERGQANIFDTLTTSEAALADMIPAGSSIDLEVGEEMSFESLLYAVMLESANDASNVLAEHLGGTIENFIQMMNNRAAELGAHNTNFTNAHGLTEEGHYSTAYDLFRITQHAISLTRFVDLYSEQQRAHAATNMRYAGFFNSTNHMMTPTSPHYYPYAFGIKTGFTSAAGFCLASTATRGDISLIAVVMGIPADLDDTNHFTETIAIYDWAFETFSHQEIFSATTDVARVPVTFGEGADDVRLRPAESVMALVQTGINTDNLRQEVVIFSERDGETLHAPIAQGTVLGAITLYYGDRSFGPIPLIAAENIQLSRVAYMQSELTDALGSIWVRVAVIVLILLFLLYIIYAIRHSVKKRRRKRERLGRR